MRSDLEHKLDNVGWMPPDDPEYVRAVFLWMQEATSEIRCLKAEIARLREVDHAA